MSKTARRPGLILPLVAIVAGLAVLMSLGIWQVQRLEWKQGLISRIEQRASAEPMSLREALAVMEETGDVEYLRVTVTGSYWHDAEMRLFSPGPEGSGWHIITPLRARSGGHVLVNRGYVPEGLIDGMDRPVGQVAITGLLRAPEAPGAFTPDNEPENNIWFWRDLDAMSTYADRIILTRSRFQVLPFFVDAENAGDDLWPRGGVTRLELPNRHLEYALTWFGMAGALVVVGGFWLRARFRDRRVQGGGS